MKKNKSKVQFRLEVVGSCGSGSNVFREEGKSLKG